MNGMNLNPKHPPPKKKGGDVHIYRASVDGFWNLAVAPLQGGSLSSISWGAAPPVLSIEARSVSLTLRWEYSEWNIPGFF